MPKEPLEINVDAPWSQRPSELLGSSVSVMQGKSDETFQVVRAYTFHKYPWGRKRLKLFAEAVDGVGGNPD